MAAVFCLDFDDTLVLENTTRASFERFADPAWHALQARYDEGEMSVEQFNAAAIDLVDPSVETSALRQSALDAGAARPGLLELFGWLDWHGWVAVVVSNGFDFAVDAVLDGLGVKRVARHAGRTSHDYRWRVRYLSPRGIEITEGFKLSYVSAFLGAGDFVSYAGDGASDVAAASAAHVVFARQTLLARLSGTRERVYAFETFFDVVNVLEREGDAWLESFSSMTAGAG